jgi:WhiB family redox-sensing transcriptional regulator
VVQKNALEGFMSLPQSDDGLPVSWQQHAACRKTDSDVFFPTSFNRSTLAAARRYCQVCPVIDTCLEYAITIGAGEGIWGGATPAQRSLAKLNTRLALIR